MSNYKPGFALNTENINDLARQLFHVGAINCLQYHKLKLHEKNPEAPLSPFFLNLRTPDNPKPGPLTPEIVDKIAEIFYDYVVLTLDIPFDFIVGIPNAADPFVKAFARLLPGGEEKILYLTKITEGGKREIGPLAKESSAKIKPGQIVLPFDDLVTQADSKLEAFARLEEAGLIVNDVVVLVDRQQGGAEQVAKAGYTLHKIYDVADMLARYRQWGCISIPKYKEICAYLRL